MRGMHPDVVEFEPEGNQILVAQAEAVIREAHRAPIEAEHKVVALFEADRLNEQASNKLLKTIEEPPARSTIMLVTSSPDRAPRDRALALPAHRPCAAPRGGSARRTRPRARRSRVGRRSRPGWPVAGSTAVGRCSASSATRAATRSSTVRGAARRDRRVGDARRRPGDRGAAGRRRPPRRADRERPRSTSSSAELDSAPGIPSGHEPRLLKRQAERHRRQHRRARTDLLLEGITALESVYRDVLAGPERRPASNTGSACARAHAAVVRGGASTRAAAARDAVPVQPEREPLGRDPFDAPAGGYRRP